MSNHTESPPPHAPWGYQYLATQELADATWMFQIIQGLTLGGYCWDIILSFIGDCEFIFYRRFNYVTALYITNRLAATVCVIEYFLINNSTPIDCDAINKAIAISESITQFTSAALLLPRIIALYHEQLYVVIFMSALLIPGPVINVTIWVGQRVLSFPHRSGCWYPDHPPKYVNLPFILQAIYDLLVFALCVGKLLATSDLSLLRLGHQPTGAAMKIRREFLKGGFIYYVPNVAVQIVTLFFVVQKALYVQFITTACADAVASAQSLRITRKLWKAGLLQNNTDNYFLPPIDEGERGEKDGTGSKEPRFESGEGVMGTGSISSPS